MKMMKCFNLKIKKIKIMNLKKLKDKIYILTY